MTDKKHVRQLLDKLKELDRTVHRASYEMGQILCAFKEQQLFKLLNYPSFTAMVEEELSFSTTSAHCYARSYFEFRRLKYNKTDALRLLENFGMRNLAKVMPNLKDKISNRAMKNRVDALQHPVSFWLTPDEEAELQAKLMSFGLVVTEETGRWINSTETFMDMVRSINTTKAA